MLILVFRKRLSNQLAFFSIFVPLPFSLRPLILLILGCSPLQFPLSFSQRNHFCIFVIFFIFPLLFWFFWYLHPLTNPLLWIDNLINYFSRKLYPSFYTQNLSYSIAHFGASLDHQFSSFQPLLSICLLTHWYNKIGNNIRFHLLLKLVFDLKFSFCIS